MSVFHCPLCPLIFQYRTEAESHLQEEHRSRAREDADWRDELQAASTPLDGDRLRALRASKAGPSVTLLLGTAPAATMTVLDIARLRQLAERARRRLSGEPGSRTDTNVVEHRLSKAVSAAESLSTDRGLAVLVNRRDLAVISLPFAPRDRQVIDEAFATRELEYALRRFPQYRILVLGQHPRVLEGRAGRLTQPTTEPRRHRDTDALLLERIDAAGPLPLIVIGDRRHLGQFRRKSRFTSDVIAEVPRPRLWKAAVDDVASQTLSRLHQEEQAHTVAELLHTELQGQVAWGIQAAWHAVTTRAADRLWVEHDFAVPGRVAPGRYGIETTNDPAEPGVFDDLVDTLLTKAAELGILVDLLEPGTLDRPEPIAVRTRLVSAPATDHQKCLAAT
jgi:hypothetical protein